MSPLSRHTWMFTGLLLVIAGLLSACSTGSANGATLDPAAQGEAVFLQAGCLGCHTVTSEPRVGPGLKDVLSDSNDRPLPDGQARTEAGVAHWIREGGAGPNGVMPAHPNLSDSELQALIAYLKSLK